MKKIIAILAICLVLPAAGCSSPVSVQSSAAPTAVPASTAPAQTASAPAATATPEATPTPTEEPTLAPTEPASTPEPLSADDLQVVVEDEYFYLQTNVQDIIDVMGDGYTTKTVTGQNGKEKDYVYTDITLMTYSEQGMDVVFAVEFTGDAFDTARGVHVGSTADEVKAAFGSGYYEDNGAYVYTFNGKKADANSSSITFKISGGEVTAVILYNAGEIQ